jgi:FKBP-type peptidyl-prolyl cis-trans isomerase FkpA
MSVSTPAHPPRHGASLTKFWLGVFLVIAIGIGLAWFGAGYLRPEVTPSGLQFRTIESGSGAPIGPADAALLDYIGTLDDGTVFDSSQAHGGPQPFTEANVFPGFAEAMGKMSEGGHYRFTMPKRLAFGLAPAPQGFTGDSLTFEVKVRKIVRGGAALLRQEQAAQEQAQSGEGQPVEGQPGAGAVPQGQ